MKVHLTSVGVAAALMTAIGSPAQATSEQIVINSENRSVFMNHTTGGCQSFQSETADPLAPFTTELAVDLACEVMLGEDVVSQDSIVSGDALSGSGHSAIVVEPTGSWVWAKHLTYSTYGVSFQILEPTPFHLTAQLNAEITCPGGYQAAKALLNFNGPDGPIHSTSLNVFAVSNALAEGIDIEGVLQPGTYSLSVKAENYMDISVYEGDQATSHSSFEFDLVLDAPEPIVPGDLNGDGIVNVFDLLQLLADWGPCADIDNCPADLSGDGRVDVFDLLQLLALWG